MRGIFACDFEKPSAIQQRAFKRIMKDRDVIAEMQVLCLSVTRELAVLVQIQKIILDLGDFMNDQCHVCIGGLNLGEDIRKLDYDPHVVSDTSGRVYDMIRRRAL